MKNLNQNPDTIGMQIEKERERLMWALIKNESIMVVSGHLKKVLELTEQRKNLMSLHTL